MIQFWFQSFSWKALGFFRVILGSSLFFLYWERQKDVLFFYTDDGLISKSLSLSLFPEFMRPSWSWAFWPDSWASSMHAAMLMGFVFTILGVGGRPLIFATWVLNIAFLQRNFAVNFGADLIGNIWLFYLILTGPGPWFNLSHFKKGWRYQPAEVSQNLLSRVGVHLIMIHLCIIYFYTGIEKLRGGSWWDGTALWTVLINSQMVIFNLEWIKNFSFLIVSITWITILFEIFFWPFVFSRRYRIPVLLFGVAFHLSIGVSMALMPFASVMLAPYSFFILNPRFKKMYGKKS